MIRVLRVLPIPPKKSHLMIITVPSTLTLLFSWRFEATHLLVGRLKPMAKTSLLNEFDIIASTLKIEYDKEKVTTSIDTDSFKLFCHSEPIRYHCLLPLTNPIKKYLQYQEASQRPINHFLYLLSRIKLLHHDIRWAQLRDIHFNFSKMCHMRPYPLCKKN